MLLLGGFCCSVGFPAWWVLLLGGFGCWWVLLPGGFCCLESFAVEGFAALNYGSAAWKLRELRLGGFLHTSIFSKLSLWESAPHSFRTQQVGFAAGGFACLLGLAGAFLQSSWTGKLFYRNTCPLEGRPSGYLGTILGPSCGYLEASWGHLKAIFGTF